MCSRCTQFTLHSLLFRVPGKKKNSTMSSECAAGFCRARFALRDAQRVGREETSELNKACRSSRNELLNHMIQHGIQCVTIEDAGSGNTQFARVVDRAGRQIPLKCAEDVLKFSYNLSNDVREVTDLEVPERVSKLILSRTKLEIPGKRLAVTKSVPSNVVVTSKPPSSVWRATNSFVSFSQDHVVEQKRVEGLKARVRDSEKQLTSVLAPNDPIVLKVVKPDGSERLVRIENTVQTQSLASLGPRKLSEMVMKAARHALQDRSRFDERFEHMIRTLFEQHRQTVVTSKPKLRVVERRITRRMAATNNGAGSQAVPS